MPHRGGDGGRGDRGGGGEGRGRGGGLGVAAKNHGEAVSCSNK